MAQLDAEGAARILGEISKIRSRTKRGDAAPAASAPAGTRVGSSEVGAQPTKTSLRRATIGTMSDADSPVLLLTAHGGRYQDTFGVTTAGVGRGTVQANLWRQDLVGTGWGQDMWVDWLLTPPHAGERVKAGTAPVGTATGNRRVQVLFPTPFPAAPRVVLTARGSDYPDTFAVSTTAVTPAGFAANIVRLDAPGGVGVGWGQDLMLDWLAWLPGGLPDLGVGQSDSGTAPIGSRGSKGVQAVEVRFSHAMSGVPVVLATARGADFPDDFAVTTTAASASAFGANILRVDADLGWGQNLALDWLAIVPPPASQR
jgi:hypothetical protein